MTQGPAIFRGQTTDRAAYIQTPTMVFETAVRGTRVRGFGNVVERHGYNSCRDAAQFRTIEVRRQREEPRGKGRILAPLAETAVGAQKGLLGHIFRATTIVTEAVGQVNQRTLPASDNPFKGGNVPSQHSFDIGLIVAGARVRSHSGLCLNGVTLRICGRLHY